jgi:hypothetical protein
MATTTNFGWETPDDTDLVKDGALAIRTLGSAIDTSLVDLKGGTTGQVLSKTSNTDMDFTWVAQDDSNAIQNTIVDAKGDLITATGSDVPARLAVGNNGDTLLADSSATTGLRWTATPSASNPILNSSFDIWQRGTSLTATGSTSNYTADRWQSYNGSSAFTISRQATGDTTNLPNIQYCARVQRNSGSTATTYMYFSQGFETANAVPYAGKTVTLSFYARKGANFSDGTSAFRVGLDTGTGTDQNWLAGYTGVASTFTGNPVLTTTWQRFSYSGTLATTATELAVWFEHRGSGTAGAADYYEVTGIQLDIGSVALPYRRNSATLAGELAACQRYYYRLKADAASRGLSAGMAYSTGFAWMHFNFPVEMRTRPTALEQSGTAGDYQMWKADSTKQVCTAVPVYDGMTTTRFAFFYTTTGSGLVAGNATYVESVNSNAFLGWSAEL